MQAVATLDNKITLPVQSFEVHYGINPDVNRYIALILPNSTNFTQLCELVGTEISAISIEDQDTNTIVHSSNLWHNIDEVSAHLVIPDTDTTNGQAYVETILHIF